ncbi:MAG: Holliday junction resolvase RuvX [Anaerolineales bacterium]
MRILCIDHGEKRIGVALSDETATIASPLAVIEHTSRTADAAQAAQLAAQHGAGRIIIGQSFDEDGFPNPAGRRAARFAEALQAQTDLPIELWDESFSTQDARAARVQMGGTRKKRGGHQDALAATVILQSYLEAKRQPNSSCPAS